MPAPPPQRRNGRNRDWGHLFNADIISMPDKWEYPWFAAWDLAFHMIPMARVDPEFAKDQLLLFLRECVYASERRTTARLRVEFPRCEPAGQCLGLLKRVYKIRRARRPARHWFPRAGRFQKLLINFTWWVNRKDVQGKQHFRRWLPRLGQHRSLRPLEAIGALRPLGLAQADGTAWMAFYCATMLSMALELARTNPSYEDTRLKVPRTHGRDHRRHQ